MHENIVEALKGRYEGYQLTVTCRCQFRPMAQLNGWYLEKSAATIQQLTNKTLVVSPVHSFLKE
jgi:hypothetical protein